jgi:hypothetical protein
MSTPEPIGTIIGVIGVIVGVASWIHSTFARMKSESKANNSPFQLLAAGLSIFVISEGLAHKGIHPGRMPKFFKAASSTKA